MLLCTHNNNNGYPLRFLYLFYSAMPSVWLNWLCVILWPFGRRDRHVEAESGVDRLHHGSCTNIFVHYQKTAECWCVDQHINKCLDTHWHLCMFVLLHLWKCLVAQWKTSQLHEYLSSSLKSILIKLKLNSNLPWWVMLGRIQIYISVLMRTSQSNNALSSPYFRRCINSPI